MEAKRASRPAGRAEGIAPRPHHLLKKVDENFNVCITSLSRDPQLATQKQTEAFAFAQDFGLSFALKMYPRRVPALFR